MLRISSRINAMSSRSILFTRDLTLDVSVRNRNGRFIFSKYCTMADTRHTRHEAIRFTYKQMQHRDMLFRYANRHDFIARPSDCSPRAIFLSLAPFPNLFSLSFSLLFFVICILNRAELLQYGSRQWWWRQCVPAAENLK